MVTMGHQSKLLTAVKKDTEIFFFPIDLGRNISQNGGRIFHLNCECLHAHLA